MGRDLSLYTGVPYGLRFNPRARMGRDKTRKEASDERSSFNPRARMGRDIKKLNDYAKEDAVSIHAPAWGATSR